MKILVTGSQSFVGKRLAPLLQSSGHDVYGIARTGITSQHQLIGDLSQSSTYEALPNDINAVVHLAAVTSPPDYDANNLILNNAEATRQLVNFSKKIGVSHFIYASSVSVYGEINKGVLDEEHPFTNPSVYGLSKLMGEKLLQQTQSEFVSYSLRLPAIIGKGATRHWLSMVYQKLLDGEAIEIYNPDSAFNNCIHVENLCSFIKQLLETSGTGSHAMNVSCDQSITVRDCIATMADLLHSQSTVTTVDNKRESFSINIERARGFGFEPWSVQDSLHRWIT